MRKGLIDGNVCHCLLASSGTRRLVPATPSAALWMILLCAMPAVAQDVVYLDDGAGGQRRVVGRIVDYHGAGLRIVRTGGQEERFSAADVLKVDTPHGPRFVEAEAAFARRQFSQARTLFQRALEEEPRRWVRREIIARLVWCHRALGRPGEAGEEFLLLIRTDPQTPYFDCIPLAWAPSVDQTGALEAAARGWLQRQEPAAVLLGASHLLSGPMATRAMAKLRELIGSSDQQLAQLAMAQTWRNASITAEIEQINTWSRNVQKMPQRLAAGPCFVLARARAQRKQWEAATLGFLRVAILYPEHRTLAARSLLDAGRSLEKISRTDEARRLYHEVVRDYPEEGFTVAEALQRIEATAKGP